MAKYYREADPKWGYTNYAVAGDKHIVNMPSQEEETTHSIYPTARVSVKHGSYIANFDQRGQRRLFLREDPTTLFEETPAVINGAFSHTNMRPHVPLLLAMAKKEFPGAIPDSDLSRHSSRLVENAVKRGLVKPPPGNPEVAPVNIIDFDDRDNTVDYMSMNSSGGIIDPENIVSDTDVRAARQNLRNMLRPKKTHMGRQFDKHQGMDQLPGVDW